MPLRAGHGTGSGEPRVEVSPADELPKPEPMQEPEKTVPLVFRPDGRIGDKATASELGRRGGLTTQRRVRLIDSLGLAKIAEESSFKPYRDAAEEFVSHHRSELAKQAGGQLGAAPSTMVASAGLQLAASRWAFDKGANWTVQPNIEMVPSDYFKLGSQLANESRQNLLAAYELAVREAQARAGREQAAPLDAIRGRIGKP